MHLTPKEIVDELDKHIIGQHQAKRAVAIALRNRYRRQRVAEPMRSEITPKNILLIGPTGVGKTEIARRLAKLADAPFIKVEATKFTEVGYVGKDVESIIRDLAEIAFKENRETARKANFKRAKDIAYEKILDILLPKPKKTSDAEQHDSDLNSEGVDSHNQVKNASNVKNDIDSANNDKAAKSGSSKTREHFAELLLKGELDDKEITLDVKTPRAKIELMGPPALEEITSQLQSMFDTSFENGKKRKQRMKIKDALQYLIEEEASGLVNEEQIRLDSVKSVEQNGIVFIDEIDKVANKNDAKNTDVSRSGVQRDLLPLVEGTTVNTKYGMIQTDHILFIASGAFHVSKPSDLLPELQGRFPIRVELTALTAKDFEQILTSTDACLTEQYKALLVTEDVHLQFLPQAISKIAKFAFDINEKMENIGARRLYTIMERLLEDILFDPLGAKKTKITGQMVEDKLSAIAKSKDLSRYVL